MLLSPHEVAWLGAQVGFTTNACKGLPTGVTATEIETFVAVCTAESGLDSEIMGRSATGANVGNRDHGLSQLSGKFIWDRIIAHGGRWRDPLVNAQIAFEVFAVGGKDPSKPATDPVITRTFFPWAAFTSGNWQQFLPDAKIGAAHPWPYVDPMAAAVAANDDLLKKAQDDLAVQTAKVTQLTGQVSSLSATNAGLLKKITDAKTALG